MSVVKATPRISAKPVSPAQQSNSNATIIAESEPDEALIKRIFTHEPLRSLRSKFTVLIALWSR